MSGLSSIDIFFHGFIPTLRDFLTNWNPGNLESERKYQESLFDFLKTELPECIIRKDYPEAGSLIDIYLKQKGFIEEREVFFELKHDLSDKPEFNRLVGQLIDLNPKKRKIIVVLCGKTEPSIPLRLREHFQEYLIDPMYLGDAAPNMAIVQK